MGRRGYRRRMARLRQAAVAAGLAWCVGTLVVGLRGAAQPVVMLAQGTADWGYPYCGPQPRIKNLFDHSHPDYGRDGLLVSFDGRDLTRYPARRPCGSEEPDAYLMGYGGHNGIDYMQEPGWQACPDALAVPARFSGDTWLVFSVHGGIVRQAGWQATDGPAPEDRGYGLHVVVDHGDGSQALYGHLSAVFVQAGERVGAWQPLGGIGDSGASSGRHLHFTAAKGDVFSTAAVFDPYGWNRDYGAGYDPPDAPDPHGGDGHSERKLRPGGSTGACPAVCRDYVVDDLAAAAAVQFSCPAGQFGCPWRVATPGLGPAGNTHQRAPASGGSATTAWVRTWCVDELGRPCPPGDYLVYAANPRGPARSRVARYRPLNAGRAGISAVAQNDDLHASEWLPVGRFQFTGQPGIELSNRSDGYGIVPDADEFVQADALRFAQVCAAPGG